MGSVAQAGVCDAVVSSTMGVFKQAYATDMIMTVPGKTDIHTEMIFDGTVLYRRIKDVWHKSPLKVQDFTDAILETQKKAASDCEKHASEAIAGKPASLFTMHSTTDDTTSDSRIWIANDSGLPLQVETRFKDGMIVKQVFQYDHIKAPSEFEQR